MAGRYFAAKTNYLNIRIYISDDYNNVYCWTLTVSVCTEFQNVFGSSLLHRMLFAWQEQMYAVDSSTAYKLLATIFWGRQRATAILSFNFDSLGNML